MRIFLDISVYMSINSVGNGPFFQITPTPQSSVSGGWIYLLMTQSDGDRVKIGKTKNNPIDRLATLRCGDPYLSMIGAFFIPETMGKINDIEKWIHDWFEGCRIRFFEHLRSSGGIPAYRLDDRELIGYSEWFRVDVLEASDKVHHALIECLGVGQIYLANEFWRGAYPTGLAYYSQEMLLQMFGGPRDVDDDLEFGDLGSFGTAF